MEYTMGDEHQQAMRKNILNKIKVQWKKLWIDNNVRTTWRMLTGKGQ